MARDHASVIAQVAETPGAAGDGTLSAARSRARCARSPRADTRFELTSATSSPGRPAAGHRRARRGPRAGRQAPGAAGRHRQRQDLHHRVSVARAGQPARPGPRPQQDPGRPALPGVQGASSPTNAVEYFVSYYDYYQPEAYVPQSDTYIEKEATINDEIDRMRLSATRSLFERRDVVIVASVSCIYGLGSPEAYYGMLLFVRQGDTPRPPRPAGQAGGGALRPQRHATCAAAPSGCGATSWSSCPPTRRRASASSCSATRWRRSPASTP